MIIKAKQVVKKRCSIKYLNEFSPSPCLWFIKKIQCRVNSDINNSQNELKC